MAGWNTESFRSLAQSHLAIYAGLEMDQCIGVGCEGVVFTVKKKDGKQQMRLPPAEQLVVKVMISYGGPSSVLKYSRLFSDLGIGPKFYDGWCFLKSYKSLSYVYIVLMQRLDRTLHRYLQENPSHASQLKMKNAIDKKLQLLHVAGYGYFADELHQANVMLDDRGEVYLIDFSGESIFLYKKDRCLRSHAQKRKVQVDWSDILQVKKQPSQP